MKARIFDRNTNQYVVCDTRFHVVVSGRSRYFDTQELADKFAGEYYKQQGIILGIEQVPV